MRKLSIISTALTALLTLGLGACSHDDGITSYLSTPNPKSVSATVSTLSFNWAKVEGATQYGYELKNPAGTTVIEDVTNATQVTITGLEPATTYTLEVWAYADMKGKIGTSPAATIEGTTAATQQLAKPQLEVTLSAGTANVYWEAVPNATSYEYSYEDRGEEYSGSTTDCYLYLTGLTLDEHTVTVKAVSDMEEYTESDVASITFTVAHSESWTAQGKYTATHLGETFDVTLVAYDDGQYSLLNWYGIDGYNFDFKVEDDSHVVPLDTYKQTDEGEYMIPTGRYDQPYIYLSVSPSMVSSFQGSSMQGEMKLYTCNFRGSYDTYVWAPTAKELWRVSGVYTSHLTNESYPATMIAYEGDAYRIKAFYGVEGYDLAFTYSESAGMDITEYYGYYEDYGYWINTGLDDVYGLYLWPWNGYSYLNGTETAGAAYFYTAVDAWGYDTFTWGTETRAYSPRMQTGNALLRAPKTVKGIVPARK